MPSLETSFFDRLKRVWILSIRAFCLSVMRRRRSAEVRTRGF